METLFKDIDYEIVLDKDVYGEDVIIEKRFNQNTNKEEVREFSIFDFLEDVNVEYSVKVEVLRKLGLEYIVDYAKAVVKDALFSEISNGFYEILDNSIIIDIGDVLSEAIELARYGKYYTIAWCKDTRHLVTCFINSLEFDDFDEFLLWLGVDEKELIEYAKGEVDG